MYELVTGHTCGGDSAPVTWKMPGHHKGKLASRAYICGGREIRRSLCTLVWPRIGEHNLRNGVLAKSEKHDMDKNKRSAKTAKRQYGKRKTTEMDGTTILQPFQKLAAHKITSFGSRVLGYCRRLGGFRPKLCTLTSWRGVGSDHLAGGELHFGQSPY